MTASELKLAELEMIIQLRDFKRREENDADLVRLAREVMGLDTAPSEMPPVWPSFEAPERDPA